METKSKRSRPATTTRATTRATEPHAELAATAHARAGDTRSADAPRPEPVPAPAPRRPRLFAELEAPASSASAAPPARTPRWRTLFAAASSREILARIVPDDALDVRAVVARRLHDQALLADADRVHLRSLALVARWAPRYQGEPDFDAWLERIVDRALLEIVDDDTEEHAPPSSASATPSASSTRNSSPTRSSPQSAHSNVAPEPAASGEPESCISASARALGLSPERLRGACRAFNRLPADERRAFFELVLRARPLQELARESGRSAVELARLARRALDTLLATAPANFTDAAPSANAAAQSDAPVFASPAQPALPRATSEEYDT